MRILTLAKQVPDSSAAIKVLPGGGGIDPTGLKLVLDPFDEFGIELALQLREKRSDVSEIVALTLGPDKAAEALRVALANQPSSSTPPRSCCRRRRIASTRPGRRIPLRQYRLRR